MPRSTLESGTLPRKGTMEPSSARLVVSDWVKCSVAPGMAFNISAASSPSSTMRLCQRNLIASSLLARAGWARRMPRLTAAAMVVSASAVLRSWITFSNSAMRASRAVTCASPCGIHACAPCSSDFNFGPPGAINCFQKTKQTVNRASCLKIGFKNVQAYKVWHGANGWLDSCPCSAAALGPPGTRYLAVQVSLDVYDYAFNETRCIGCCDAGDNPVIIDTYDRQHDVFTSQVVIGRTNGQATVTQVSQERSEIQQEGSNPCTDPSYLSCSSPYGNCATPGFTWGYYSIVQLTAACDPRYVGLVNTIVNACPQNFSHHINSSGDPTPPFGISSIWGNPGVLTVSVSETVIQVNYQDDTFASGGTGIVAAITITLSSPYAGSDCVNDCIALLGEWNLTDDLVYPWRSDTMVNLAPLVTYDESNRGDPLSWIISPAGVYGGGTGALLGAPTPCNAAQGCCDLYWNPTHPNYSYGIIDDEGDMGWILGSYGAYSPPWCPQPTPPNSAPYPACVQFQRRPKPRQSLQTQHRWRTQCRPPIHRPANPSQPKTW